MTATKGRIDREGAVSFGEARIDVWEEGLNPRMTWDERVAWERKFKHDVFKRIIQTMNRLGWRVGSQHHIHTHDNARYCIKGDLKADLQICGRHIELEFFQSVNTPTRPDHEGRYESNKEACMPYLVRLEMQRTRNRIRDYLINVFTGYTFKPPGISSPNPDPLAYFNDKWDGEYEKRRGVHRFKRGPDGWPSEDELGSWDRKDRDGTLLNQGDERCMRDRNGRLLRGKVYGGINGMWMMVYGPGQRDHTHENAKAFFMYRPGETPRKLASAELRRKRLEQELKKAVASMNFLRANTLKNILFPAGPLYAIWHKGHQSFFAIGYCGYRDKLDDAGHYTRDELKPYLGDQLETRDFKAIPIGEPA